MGVAAADDAWFTVRPKVTRSSPTVDTDEFDPSVGRAGAVLDESTVVVVSVVVVSVVVVSVAAVSVVAGAVVAGAVVLVDWGSAEHSVGIDVVVGGVVGEVVTTVAGAVVATAGTVVVEAEEPSDPPPRVITNRAAPMITMRAMSTLANCLNGTARW